MKNRSKERSEKIKAEAESFCCGESKSLGSGFPAPGADIRKGLEKAGPERIRAVIDLSNWRYFSSDRTLSSLAEAEAVLGPRRFFQVCLGAALQQMMDRPVPGYNLAPGELWAHGVGVAVAAEEIGRIIGRQEKETVFTAGLLHDVGKLVLGDHVEAHLDEIRELTQGGISFEIAERRVLGLDHTQLGQYMLSCWGFTREIRCAVRRSHDPDGADPVSEAADVLHVANVLCLSIGIGVGQEGLQYKSSPNALRRLKVTTRHLELVASHTLQWIKDLPRPFGASPS